MWGDFFEKNPNISINHVIQNYFLKRKIENFDKNKFIAIQYKYN
jgi:hypothetical protein